MIGIAMLASVLYSLELSGKVMSTLELRFGLPLYSAIVEYGAHAVHYRTGYRYDFLVFSIAPLLGWLVARVVVPRAAIRTGPMATLYATLLIPFLFLGYGAYMDRWLYPAWMILPTFCISMLLNVFAFEPTERAAMGAGVAYVVVELVTALVFPHNVEWLFGVFD